MMIFHDIEQNSDEWYVLRAGKLTSSSLSKVMANYGKAFSLPAKHYAVKIAIEKITKQPIASNYYNEHMARGHDQEPFARKEYENEKFCDVSNGGFFCDEFVGCSPDGLVGEDEGVIEIKSVLPHVHFANMRRGSIDPAYKWQCIANLCFTGAKWMDFISYCEDFPEHKKIYVCRMHRNDFSKEQKMLSDRILEFEDFVWKTHDMILEGEYSTNSTPPDKLSAS